MAPASSFIKVQAGQKQSGSRWRKVYARKRRAQDRIKKKRRSTEWQAQPNPIHMAIAHHIHFPQAEATINVLSPKPRGTIRVLSIVPPLWLAPAARGGGASLGRANGTRRRRAAPGSTLNIHRGRRGRVGGQGAPSSTSALPPRRHGPIKRQPPPQSTDLRGSWRRHTHCRFLFSVSSARRRRRGRRGRGSRGSKSKILRWAILCWQLR